MKGKRLVASMLALLLVVSLLPMAAMADYIDIQPGDTVDEIKQGDTTGSNPGTVNNNHGNVSTNTATIVNNGTAGGGRDSGSVSTNSGRIENNYGYVGNSHGTINHNQSGGYVSGNNTGGTVETNAENATIESNVGTVGKKDESGNVIEGSGNSGTIKKNYGTVFTNNATGIVESNDKRGTIEVNNGLVGQKDGKGNLITDGTSGNFGTVEDNMTGGIVTNNTGTVENNAYGGIVAKNNKGGTVVNNDGIVIQNNNQVENNNAGGTVQYNDGFVANNQGTVDNNSGYVWNYGGTVAINNPDGYVHGDGESVATNYGTRVTNIYDGTTDNPTWFFGVHFENDQKEMVYLGDYERGGKVTLTQLQENCTGYKIYGIEAVAAYNRGEDKFEEGTAGTTLTEFTINAPTRLKLLWERIISVVKPASSGGGEAVPTSYNPEYIGLGSVVTINGSRYKVVEIKDDALVVVSFDALSDEDVKDLDALFAKLFTAEQQKLIKNVGQLLDSEDVLTIFGKPGNHPVFEISKDLV